MLNRSPLDTLLAALAEPTRRDMVEVLASGPRPVTALAQRYDMTLSAVSQHLKVLVSSGLVTSTRVGRIRLCAVEPEALETVERWMSARRSQIEARVDRFAEYLSVEQDREQ